MRTKRYWQDEKVELLKRLWTTEHDMTKVIAAFPGKTWSALSCKASELGFFRLVSAKPLPATRLSLTNTEAAWLAGFLDGEGCFAIYIQKRSSGIYYHPRVQATNTSQEVLETIKMMTGCGCIVSPEKTVEHWKPIHTWIVNNHQYSRAVLEAVLPYLRVKRKQAEILIEFIDCKLEVPTCNSRYRLDDQARLFEKIKALNSKGSI